MNMKKMVLSLGLLLSSAALALEPVTGLWGDTGNVQPRTGYAIEVQNNSMWMSIYTYSQNNSTTDPTWYNAGGTLTQHDDGTASGSFRLYNVSNNTTGQVKAAGMMRIKFTDRETAEIIWEGFPGHIPGKTTIKKFWFVGQGTSPQAKRIAAQGTWQYSVSVPDKLARSVTFPVTFYDLKDTPKYANVKRTDTLIGEVKGVKGVQVVKIFYASGVTFTMIRVGENDYYFLEAGGVEYSFGKAALVAKGKKPTVKDFKYNATSVRTGSVDTDDSKIVHKSALNSGNAEIQELIDLARAAAASYGVR